MASRNVVVIMPFGGADKTAQRRSLLDFLRIKHVVSKLVDVRLSTQQGDVQVKLDYDVQRVEFAAGAISRDVKKAILSADVVIAVVTDYQSKQNNSTANVIYELAFRFEMKGRCIILLRGDARALLPSYVENQIYGNFDDNLSEAYVDLLAHFVEKGELSLDPREEVPRKVAAAIGKYDTALKVFLQNALHDIESGIGDRPGSIDIVPALDIGHNLWDWTTFYPYNVVRVSWKRRSHPDHYEPADLDGEPVVYAANEDYLKMFDFQVDPKSVGPQMKLTGRALLERLSEMKCCPPADLERFMQDQGELTTKIVFGLKSGRAKAPLVFNDDHPHAEFRGRCYLPSLVAMCTPGAAELLREHPHYSYFIVVFIEQPRPEVI